MDKKKIDELRQFFQKEKSVLLAFLYGSQAKGRAADESDVDIGVHVKNSPEEEVIWQKLTALTGQEVDVVNLNDAPPTLVANIFKTGIPLSIKDKNLYWKYYLEKSLEGEDFAEFALDYWKIYERSQSLSPEDRTRLIERLHFLELEVSELHHFKKLSYREYEKERSKRRDIERWTENILNALIDVAKIMLASEKQPMPKTYEEALRKFALFAGLNEKEAAQFAGFSRLRNIIAHEYLDILYDRIHRFSEEFPPLYEKLMRFLKDYLK